MIPPPRQPAVMLILSIVTCGIYYLYYVYAATQDCNDFTRRQEQSPGTEVVLTIVTCGIYNLYWDYRMGKRLAEMCMMVGLPITDNAVLYLVLDLFGIGFINALLQQETMNRIWDASARGAPYTPGSWPPPPGPPYYHR
jgi:hypothetical protein